MGMERWWHSWSPELQSGVNFTNVLQTAFTQADPNSAKKTDYLTVFFGLSGSALVKANHITLMKLTLDNSE